MSHGVGTYQINSFWESGNLIFYEKTVGHTDTGDVLTIGSTAVKVGGTAQAVDFSWYATGSASVVISASGTSLTLVGVNMATNAPVVITDATASTTTATGALIVSGGVGIAKGLFVGEVVSVGTVCQPDTSDGAALGTTSLMWQDLFLASGGVINFDAGDVTLTHSANTLAMAGGNLTVGGTVGITVADQGLTVTCATLNATTGRAGKFSGSIATGNLGDGYGAVEIDITATGNLAGMVAASSSWLNITGTGVAGTGNIVAAQSNGIYADTGANTNAIVIFGMRCSGILTDAPRVFAPFSLNTSNREITALFEMNANPDVGYRAAATTNSTKVGDVPLFCDAAGQQYFVRIYSAYG